MEDRAKKYLDDILYSIGLIEDFISNTTTFNEYSDDSKTKSAVERQLGIIGEAANKFDKICQLESLENVSQIVGLRNRIIHAYDNINDSVIWIILKKTRSEIKTRSSGKTIWEIVSR